ncbi:MAG TPA: alpha/beta hydrolase [Rhizobiaceae bacterium]|nr:alpha/beta hydrolase [Rhizobiaceae bacterium]
MRWLRRPLRKIASLALMFPIFIAVLLPMFRFAATTRETQSAETAAGAGATFATVAEQQVHYRAWGPESGRPLLLIHGTLAWAETFRDIAAPLAAKGYRVIAPDLPPFGFSDRPVGHDYSRTGQAKRILAFATAMGLDRFTLGVHSYGGGAAVEAAFAEPERIDGLILLDVALGLGQEPKSAPWVLRASSDVRDLIVASTLTNPVATGLGLKAFIADDSIVTTERIDLYRRPFVMRGTTTAIGRWLLTSLFRDESKTAASNPARYEAFEPPVLVVWGREDSITPLAQGEAIAASLANAKLEVLEGVNHIPHVEKPAEVVALIDAFMRTLPGAPPDPATEKRDRVVRSAPLPTSGTPATSAPVSTPSP